MADNLVSNAGAGGGTLRFLQDAGGIDWGAAVVTYATTLADGANVLQVVTPAFGLPVSGTFWQATQPVSGPLTDAQLRASAVPVSGPLTDAQLRATAVPVSQSGAWNVGQSGTWTVDQGGVWVVAALQSGGWSVAQSGTWTVTQSGAWTVAATQSGTWNVNQLDIATSGNITTQNLVPGGVATAGSAVQLTVVNGLGNIGIQTTGTYTGALSLQGTVDNATWVTIGGVPLLDVNTGVLSATIPSAAKSIYQANIAGYIAVRVTALAPVTGTATINLRADATVAMVSLDSSLPTGTNNLGNVRVTDLTNFLPTMDVAARAGFVKATDGTNTAAVKAASTAVAAADPALVVGISPNTAVAVTPPTLTKGTQGATGFSVQDLKDAGRVRLSFYATAVAAGATTVETAITLTKSSDQAATTTGVSFVVTNGKRFRITNISVATRGHSTATAQTTTFNFRINTGGAVITTSTPIIFAARSATPATASAWDRYIIPIPDGFEILGDGTLQFGITAAATYVTNAPTWDVNIIGFEY